MFTSTNEYKANFVPISLNQVFTIYEKHGLST